MTDQLTRSAPTADPTPGRQPWVVAVMTVFAAHALVAASLLAWALIANANEQPAPSGEDWSGLIATIILVFTAGFLTVTTAAGCVIANKLMNRRLARMPAPSTRTAVLVGLAATGLGWLAVSVATVVAWAVYSLVSFGSLG